MITMVTVMERYYGHGGAYAAGAVAGVVIGATITAAAFSAMAVPPTPVVVSGVTYYQSGSTWYQQVSRGSGDLCGGESTPIRDGVDRAVIR